jgi:phosphate/phosphite/phosphonate ABC transporter binding protein
MNEPTARRLLPILGWTLVGLLTVAFVAGLYRRAVLEPTGSDVVRMLFVPSVEQGTLVQRGDELARFIFEDSGLTLRSQVPTSYAAVIQALGSGQADVAWIPAFAYVLANTRYQAEARLQVVRSVDRSAIIVTRVGEGEPTNTGGLAGMAVAVTGELSEALRTVIAAELGEKAPGWTEVAVESDAEAVARLLDREVDAAVSRFVPSGPHDFVGDGRKLLEARRPGALADTRVIYTTPEPAAELKTVYYGALFTRADSGIRRPADLNGRRFAFSDETSTSGHIFPRVLLQREGVELGHVLFAGGHPNVVQAVADGKVDGGASFYSPPSAANAADGTIVGDARFLLLKNMAGDAERRAFLDQVRVIGLTDPIPNDVCCVRSGFSEDVWQRFSASLQRFLATEEGQAAYYDLVAGVAAAPCSDDEFDGFRQALKDSGVSAGTLLDAAEAKLERRRNRKAGS